MCSNFFSATYSDFFGHFREKKSEFCPSFLKLFKLSRYLAIYELLLQFEFIVESIPMHACIDLKPCDARLFIVQYCFSKIF